MLSPLLSTICPDLKKENRIKVSINVYKFFFFITITIVEFARIRNSDWWPNLLGGNGLIRNCFKNVPY